MCATLTVQKQVQRTTYHNKTLLTYYNIIY